MGYFDNKTELADIARMHIGKMEAKYAPEIEAASKYTITIEEDMFKNPESCYVEFLNRMLNRHDNSKLPKISIIAESTVDAIFNANPHAGIYVLNFADYRRPGGMFKEGSSAQEESLCHASTLYNVLSRQEDFYNWNQKHCNGKMYSNRALATDGVIFERDDMVRHVSVITCAAPNNRNSDPKNPAVLDSRIEFVAKSIGYNAYKVDEDKDPESTVILGAYGCGVFHQSPYDVAGIFKKYISLGYFDYFDNIVFAIPAGKNHDAFKTVFDSLKN